MVNLDRLIDITYSVPVDTGGGSGFEKTAIMAALADHLSLTTYVEIGVYRGRSFLPLAWSFEQRGGHSFGIDPYSRDAAEEKDIPQEIRGVVEEFIQETNWDRVYRELLDRRAALNLNASTTIVRQASAAAFPAIAEAMSSPMMIHIDGNHDTKFVMEDVERYTSLLKDGDVLVLDDTDWDSVKPALALARLSLELLHSGDTFTILVKLDSEVSRRLEKLREQCSIFEWMAQTKNFVSPYAEKPLVSVSIITYNQEKYIAQAIQSALDQETDFKYEIVIGEDLSTDETRAICRKFQRAHPDKIRLLERASNLGAVPNYLDTYSACRGEFVAFLEGDDFWTNENKLQRQVDFLVNNPDYAICCHNVHVTDESGALGELLLKRVADTTSVHDLCTGDYISTPSCMIRNGQVRNIPDWLYHQPGCDWLFDILNAECGKIKYFPEAMAAYRMHRDGIWAGRSELQQLSSAAAMVVEVNHHLEYRYDREFRSFLARNRLRHDDLIASRIIRYDDFGAQQGFEPTAQSGLVKIHDLLFAVGQELARISVRFDRIDRWCASIKLRTQHVLTAPIKVLGSRLHARREQSSPTTEYDLIIVDDAYPHPQSAFRAEEYDVYLTEIPRSVVYTSGSVFHFFKEARSLDEIIAAHEEKRPALKGRIHGCDRVPDVTARLAYTVFLGNAWVNVEFFERNRIPFVFTLYPGGAFRVGVAASDELLKRVFASEMFRRVIVTQTYTRNYLISHQFVDPDKIELIYGVVTPKFKTKSSPSKRVKFGFGKSTLDICFTAHKYMPDGHDKGYDIFLDVAKKLAKVAPECRFHVVGGFSASDLPIDGLEGKITFYGGREQDWFSSFYANMDLILLCNVPFVLMEGAFDGFPTGCGSDAMLQQVALFCTDPLGMNVHFSDGEDLVIVPHEVDTIVERILWYRDNPAALTKVGESGYSKAKDLYSYETQMAPRLAVLRRELAALP